MGKRIRLASPYGRQSIMSGDIIRHVVPNGEIGEVVYEQVGGSVVVDWPGCWRSTVPAHWYEVVESG